MNIMTKHAWISGGFFVFFGGGHQNTPFKKFWFSISLLCVKGAHVAGGWSLRIVDLLWVVCVLGKILKMWKEGWIVTAAQGVWAPCWRTGRGKSFHFSPSRGQFCTGTNQGVHLGVHLLGIAAFLLLQQLHCFRNV